jgi:hypothetical protein
MSSNMTEAGTHNESKTINRIHIVVSVFSYMSQTKPVMPLQENNPSSWPDRLNLLPVSSAASYPGKAEQRLLIAKIDAGSFSKKSMGLYLFII